MRVIEIDMKQSRPRSWLQVLNVSLIVGLFALSIFTASSYSSTPAQTSAQGAITGVWTAEYPIDKNDKIQLSLSRKRDGHSNNMGFEISLSELAGLSREQALAGKSYVKFRLVREAGSFEFEGSFANGKGAGFWTLTLNQGFVSDMRSRGYDNLTDEQLITSAMLDVRTRAIDDLKAAGFDRLSIEDVFKATIFKVTPAFISELKSIGFDNLDLEELVKARIFKVDGQFAREVEAMGFGRNSLESLVKMRIFKVTPDFLREMKSAGLDNLSIEDLVKLRIFNIDTAFIQRVKASGRTDVEVEDLVRIKIHKDLK